VGASLKPINFNRKIGQRTLDDTVLSDFVQNFEKIPLRDENFEFPDLLGAAYKYLIKFFADSAGKMACEFYTPPCQTPPTKAGPDARPPDRSGAG